MCKLAIAAVALTASVLTSAVAQASTPHPFKSASIKWDTARNANPVIIVANDGEKYTHVEDVMQTHFTIQARVKTGHRIYGYIVTFDDPDLLRQAPLSNESFGAMNSLKTKKLEKNVTFSQKPAGITDMLAVNACKTAHPTIPEADKTLSGVTQIDVFAGFAAGGSYTPGFNAVGGHWYNEHASGRPAIVRTSAPAKIVCRGKPPAMDKQESAANRLDAGMSVEQFGNTCPKKTEVTLHVDYDKKTKARLRVTRNGQAGFLHRRVVETKPKSVNGETVHRAEYTFTFHLDPGLHRFQGQVRENGQWKTVAMKWQKNTCPPFEVISAWLKFDIEDKATCPKKVVEIATFRTTRPGMVDYEIKHQGGLVVHSGQIEAARQGLEYVAVHTRQFVMKEAFKADFMADVKDSPANSGWVTLKIDCLEVLSGELDLRDRSAPVCPRKGEVAFSIRTNKPGEVPYSVDCTGNRAWSGTANAVQTGQDTFIGVGVLAFQLHHTEQLVCALKSRLHEQPKILALKGRNYPCVKRTQEPVTGDLAPLPRPTVPAPLPSNIVEPPRPTPTAPSPSVVGTVQPGLSCAGGTVLRGQCLCSLRTKKVQAGVNGWRCLPDGKPITTGGPTVRPTRPILPNASVRFPNHRPQGTAGLRTSKRVSEDTVRLYPR